MNNVNECVVIFVDQLLYIRIVFKTQYWPASLSICNL